MVPFFLLKLIRLRRGRRKKCIRHGDCRRRTARVFTDRAAGASIRAEPLRLITACPRRASRASTRARPATTVG